MGESDKSKIYRFGVFRVNFQTDEFWKKGVKLRVQRQALQVLRRLIEREGELVTRAELKTAVWLEVAPNVDTDQSLNNAINKLREVLGDSAEHPRFIETIPRNGYRFIYPIEEVGTADVESAPSERAEKNVTSPVSWRKPSRIGWLIAGCTALVLLAASLVWVGRQPAAPHIVSLEDGQSVGVAEYVRGRGQAKGGNNYLVTEPLDGTRTAWIQDVIRSADWTVYAHFGDSTTPSGMKFVVYILTSESNLVVGKINTTLQNPKQFGSITVKLQK